MSGIPAVLPAPHWAFLLPLAGGEGVALGFAPDLRPLIALGLAVVAVTFNGVLLGASLRERRDVFSQVLYEVCVHGLALAVALGSTGILHEHRWRRPSSASWSPARGAVPRWARHVSPWCSCCRW